MLTSEVVTTLVLFREGSWNSVRSWIGWQWVCQRPDLSSAWLCFCV